MSYEEVQKHPKREAAATVPGTKQQRNKLRRKVSATKQNATTIDEAHGPKKNSPWRKLKKRIKKLLAPKPAPLTSSNLTTGFHCASSDGCYSCTLPPAIPPALEESLNALSNPRALNTTYSSASMSSGFTCTSTSSSSSPSSPRLPQIHIPTPPPDIQLSPTPSATTDIFADFSGAHYTETPALSAFVEKVLGSTKVASSTPPPPPPPSSPSATPLPVVQTFASRLWEDGDSTPFLSEGGGDSESLGGGHG